MPRASAARRRPATLPPLLALALAAATLLPTPASACRPRSGAAVHHSGRALGEVDLPTDPELVGVPWSGPPPGVAERTSSLRPSGLAGVLSLAAEGAARPMLYHGGGIGKVGREGKEREARGAARRPASTPPTPSKTTPPPPSCPSSEKTAPPFFPQKKKQLKVAFSPTIYYLWYGGWGGPAANTAASDTVEHFTRHLGGSKWWGLTAAYADAKGRRPSQTIRYGGSAYDAYSRGKSLSDDDIAAAVVDAIRRGDLPDDAEGIYMVLGSADVDATSGFCEAYCGFHKVLTVPAAVSGANATSSPTPWQPSIPHHRFYGYVGDPARCGEKCRMQARGPNGDSPADAMVSIIAHELAETVTDPYADAWYDDRGLEGPDKCLWIFGPGRVYVSPNGARANMMLGGRHYLVQANWAVGADRVGRCVID
jgi:hypothetical protein